MAWENDEHGIVFKGQEIKLYRNGGHTWAMKLSQLQRQSGAVRIVTYSLPNLEYVERQISRRPAAIQIICHAKFVARAQEIKRKFPLMGIAVNGAVHSKVCLIAPSTVYVGSANFGVSQWHETEVGIRSSEAHDWYVEHSFLPLWATSDEIKSDVSCPMCGNAMDFNPREEIRPGIQTEACWACGACGHYEDT